MEHILKLWDFSLPMDIDQDNVNKPCKHFCGTSGFSKEQKGEISCIWLENEEKKYMSCVHTNLIILKLGLHSVLL